MEKETILKLNFTFSNVCVTKPSYLKTVLQEKIEISNMSHSSC